MPRQLSARMDQHLWFSNLQMMAGIAFLLEPNAFEVLGDLRGLRRFYFVDRSIAALVAEVPGYFVFRSNASTAARLGIPACPPGWAALSAAAAEAKRMRSFSSIPRARAAA